MSTFRSVHTKTQIIPRKNNRTKSFISRTILNNPSDSLPSSPQLRNSRPIRCLTTCPSTQPIINSKYNKIWRRVRIKLRAVFVMKKIYDLLNLYGISHVKVIMDCNNKEGQELLKKASRMLDSNDDTQGLENIPFYIINPIGKLKTIWDWIIIITLLYIAIGGPFIMAFIDTNDYGPLYWLDIAINTLFFLDFILNFFTAFYDKKQNLICSVPKISKKYAKGWMVIDFLSWFPFDIIQGELASNKNSTLSRLAKLPKIYRLLRLSRLLKLLKGHFHNQIFDKVQEVLSIKINAIRIAKTYITVGIIIHISTCAWYFTSRLYYPDPNTWVFRYGYQDCDTGTLYITSLYWVITTLSTVGYGDIVPFTTLEKVVCLAWMSFGLYFFSFNVSNLASVVSSDDLKSNALARKLLVIDEFASELKIKINLRTKLKNSLRQSAESRGFSWKEKINLLNEIPKYLRYEIAIAMHDGVAKTLKFFAGRDRTFIACIIPLLEPIEFRSQSYIYEKESVAEGIYFVIKGFIHLTNDKGLVLEKFKFGDYFGDVEIVRNCLRRYEAFAVTHCNLLAMKKDILYKVYSEFYQIWDEIYELAMKREVKYEKTIITNEQSKEFIRDIDPSDDVRKEFNDHVKRLLHKRISTLNKIHSEPSLNSLVRKMNKIIEHAKNNKKLYKLLKETN